MTCQSSHPTYRLPARRASKLRRAAGFTLVELLVVIAIIGILVSMLAVAIFPVLIRGQAATVQLEMTQIGQGIESFKTQYGFYPPSGEKFSRFTGPTSSPAAVSLEANQLLPYLNRMFPNHRETEPSLIPARASAGFRKIDDWWVSVGVALNQQTSMIFWLSGLSESSQYPLTGGIPLPSTSVSEPADYIPCAYNEDKYVNGLPLEDSMGVPITLIRQNFYSFVASQVVTVDEDMTMALGVARYVGRYGDGEHAFGYRDAASYIPFVLAAAPPASDGFATGTFVVDPTYPNGNFPGFAYHIDTDDDSTTLSDKSFAAVDTYQIITIGMDGDSGAPDLAAQTGEIRFQKPASEDNLCSFANGRLSAFDWSVLFGN